MDQIQNGTTCAHAIVIGLCSAITATVVVPTDAVAAPFRECDDMAHRLAYNITARAVGCREARRVVRRWGNTVANSPSGDGRVRGLYCNYRSTGYESGDIRCTGSRGRVVRWQTGS